MNKDGMNVRTGGTNLSIGGINLSNNEESWYGTASGQKKQTQRAKVCHLYDRRREHHHYYRRVHAFIQPSCVGSERLPEKE